jgi:5-methylcytosine-specific restriction protein A
MLYVNAQHGTDSSLVAPNVIRRNEMPTSPKSGCRIPGCIKLAAIKGYCPEHRKMVSAKWDMHRGKAVDRGYDFRWEKIRKMKLHNSPYCEQCLKSDRATKAELVHHIDNNSHHNEIENLMSLCFHCHMKMHGDNYADNRD